MKKVKVEYYDVVSKKIPELFSGYRIAFITDLHNTLYGKNNCFLLREIAKQRPDCVMIAGDMIVGSRQLDTTVSLRLLEVLVKKYPVFYSMGNHEKRVSILPETRLGAYKKYVDDLKKLGVYYLTNHTIQMQRKEQTICITGLDLDMRYYAKFNNKIKLQDDYLTHSLGVKGNDFTILLAHNPKYFEQYVNWGADLVLSGHVHGGIVILPFLGGVIAPNYEVFPKYDSGQFRYRNGELILSRGLGVHTIKVRLWNKPELSIITLRHQKEHL